MSKNKAISDKHLETIKNFLSTRGVLVADSSGSSRSSIAKAFAELGAKGSEVLRLKNFEEAASEMESKKPNVIVTDYQLGDKRGLDLVPLHKEIGLPDEERVFIVAAGNSSETAVAEAAEEEVDGYIVKPFTGDSLKGFIAKAIVQKVSPSAYKKTIGKGKKELGDENFKGAKESFEEARKLDKRPALAFSYLGDVHSSETNLEEALSHYQKGLVYNKLHYKCLVGCFETLEKQKKIEQSYKAVEVLAKNFPVTPKRLGKVLRLAVYTRNYADVQKYYDLFKKLDSRPDELIKTVSAALVICGKYQLNEKQDKDAFTTFKNAAVASGRGKMILAQIIHYLIEAKQGSSAESFLKMFLPEDQESEQYIISDFRTLNSTEKAETVVQKGRDLQKKGFKHPLVYRIMIDRYKELKKDDAVESLTYEAAQNFPDEFKV